MKRERERDFGGRYRDRKEKKERRKGKGKKKLNIAEAINKKRKRKTCVARARERKREERGRKEGTGKTKNNGQKLRHLSARAAIARVVAIVFLLDAVLVAIGGMLVLQPDLYEIFLAVFVGGVHAGQSGRHSPEQLLHVVARLGRCFDKHHVQFASLFLTFFRCNLEIWNKMGVFRNQKCDDGRILVNELVARF